jgi:hypothetical protein
MTNIPHLDIDPFSATFLEDPYPYHHSLRDTGPVVWLPAINGFAMARYAEVRAALTDHHTYCSGRGVGVSDFAKEAPLRPYPQERRACWIRIWHPSVSGPNGCPAGGRSGPSRPPRKGRLHSTCRACDPAAKQHYSCAPFTAGGGGAMKGLQRLEENTNE